MSSVQPARRCICCDTILVSGPGDEHMRCSTCGFVTRRQIPSAADIAAVFGEHYFSGSGYADYLRERDSLEENFRNRLQRLMPFVEDASTKRLFELGCAYGFFLDMAKERFAAVRGIDISEPAARFARDELSLDVDSGDYMANDRAAGFDVFCIWDSTSELREPERYFEKIAADIAPGGILAVSAGDAGSLNARLRGSKWRIMRQKTILHNFSRDAMTRFLERKGFRVIKVYYPGQSRSVRAICRGVLGEDYERSVIGRLLKVFGLMDRSLVLNLRDMMMVIAVRR